MIQILAEDGTLLTDQRGNYLYDGRYRVRILVIKPDGPLRFDLQDMLRLWNTYCQYGNYVLRLW